MCVSVYASYVIVCSLQELDAEESQLAILSHLLSTKVVCCPVNVYKVTITLHYHIHYCQYFDKSKKSVSFKFIYLSQDYNTTTWYVYVTCARTMHTHMRTHCTHVYTHTHTHTHMHAHIRIHIHTHTYTRTHAYTHTQRGLMYTINTYNIIHILLYLQSVQSGGGGDMFSDHSKVMKLQPTELPADPGLSEVRVITSLPNNYIIYCLQQKFKVLLLRRLSRELVCVRQYF